MRLEYDPEAQALYIRLGKGRVAYSREVKKGVIVDYDRSGRPIGVEVLELVAKKSVEVPDAVLREVLIPS